MRKSSKRRNCLRYNSLEERRLLATLFVGGAGNDHVEISHVDTDIVTLKINDTVMENLDISEGLRINTKGGTDDYVWIDHRIDAEVTIINAETLVFDGGDNFWYLGAKRHSLTTSYDTAGRLNDNITFLGVHEIRTGAGNDRFTINTENVEDLKIFGGDGNDLFRFSGNPVGRHLTVAEPSIIASGDNGNDRFVFTGTGRAEVYGHDGFDILDYRNADYGVEETTHEEVIGLWNHGNDRIIGAIDHSNRFTLQSYEESTFKWIVNGNLTTVFDINRTAATQLIGFDQFTGDLLSHHQFWVLGTSQDTTILDADWLQISSSFDPSQGDLSGINHNLFIDYSRVSPQDTVRTPRVVISDAASDGSNGRFDARGTITGLTDGAIRFGGRSLHHLPFADWTYSRVLPAVVIHGSKTATDYFTIVGSQAKTTIYSHGGDDHFMLGSTNLDADGRLTGIQDSVSIFAGDGTDRVYVNNQLADFLTESSGYEVSDQVIRDASEYNDLVVGLPVEPPTPQPIATSPTSRSRYGFADIYLNKSVESIRVNGSEQTDNYFQVTPSERTRILVQGASDTYDVLNVIGLQDHRQIWGTSDQGAWTFGNMAQSVGFLDVNDPHGFLTFLARLSNIETQGLDAIDTSGFDLSTLNSLDFDLTRTELLALVESGDLSNLDLSGVDFSQLDLSDLDLSNIDLSQFNLSDDDRTELQNRLDELRDELANRDLAFEELEDILRRII